MHGSGDPRLDYDRLRDQESLALDGQGRWLVGRHADAVTVATCPHDFSSAVSRFLQVPNGLDGKAHAESRRLLDPFFAPDRMAALEPVLERIAADLIAGLPAPAAVDAVVDLGARYAVRAQSAWLGWPDDVEERLLEWIEANNAASASGDLGRTAAVAADFNAIIHSVLEPRWEAGDAAPDDVTTELIGLRDEAGRPLTEEELVSVLRNWTGGDLGSIALCVGVVLYWLATHPELQDSLAAADDPELDAAIDEMLRMDDPFVSNRRVATRDVELSGQAIAKGERVVINWTAANRDPRVFADPDAYDPATHAAANLVYGIGPHVCPGHPLATMELRVFLRVLLADHRVELDPDTPPERQQPPVGGFRRVPVRLRRLA
jgi:cytochrome P450